MLRFSRTTRFSVDTGHRAWDKGKRASRSHCDSERWIPTVIVTDNLFDTVGKISRASFHLLCVSGGAVSFQTLAACAAVSAVQ